MGVAAAVEIATGVVGPLIEAFKDAGFTPPNITFSETESTLTLIVQGAAPTGKHALSQDFVSDYWRGKLLFSESEIWRQSDSVSVSASIHHQAGNQRPHATDALKGSVCAAAQLSIDTATAGTTAASTAGPTTKTVIHEAGHSDRYVSTLTTNNHIGSFVNDILTWTFKLEGFHDDHPPLQASLMPQGAGDGLLALAINENVPDLATLEVHFDFDPRLTITDSGVEVSELFARHEGTVDCTTAGKLGLVLKANSPIGGPAHIANLHFRLPKSGRRGPYPIVGTSIRALDKNGTELPVGLDDFVLAGRRERPDDDLIITSFH